MGFGDFPSYQEEYAKSLINGIYEFSYLVYGNGYLYAASSFNIGGIYKVTIDYSKSVTPESRITLLTNLGDPTNNHVTCIAYYNNYLYASVWNETSKTVIYKVNVTTGSYTSFIKINDSTTNSYQAKGIKIYNNFLYISFYANQNYQGIYKFNMNDDNTNILSVSNNLFISKSIYDVNKMNSGYIEIDNDGNLYLTNYGIAKFDNKGSLIKSDFATAGIFTILLYKNNFFCTRYNVTINQYNIDGSYITNNFAQAVGGTTYKNYGGGIAFDNDGNFYIAQSGNPSIGRILAKDLPPWPTPIPTTPVPTKSLISEDYTFITSLRVPASKGDTKIYVKDDSKFKIGDTIQIGSSDITIAKVIGFGSLILDTPLKFDYSSNVPVGIMKDQINSNNYTIYIIIAVVVVIIICSSSSLLILKSEK